MTRIPTKSLEIRKEIRLRILAVLREKGWTQRTLAEKMGKKPEWISYLLSGKGEFTLTSLLLFEDALGITLINRNNHK